jgi:hypothetical protein
MIAISGLSGVIRVAKQFIMKILKQLTAITAGLCLFSGIILPLSASATSIAQGFVTSDTDLVVGMAASLSIESTSKTQNVIRSGTSNKAKFVGIITTKNANLLTLTNNSSTVVVATSGDAFAFVTDINGVVKKGDNLSVSPIKGLLMKSENNEVSVVGSALEDAAGKTSTKQNIDVSGDKKQEISVTSLRLEVNPHNIAGGDAKNQSFLRILGQNVAGKQVSDWQAIIALVVFLLLLVVEGSLIYGSVHSSITALGRNPMARDAVYRQLAQVLLAVLAVLAFGVAIIYLVLQI